MPFPNVPPTPPAEIRPATFFRFSLLTLLSITTLAGFVSAIVFSKHWHPDERLLLAFWCAGLILGVSVGRYRGTKGVISGGLGAMISCLLAATLLLNGWLGQIQVLKGQATMPYITFVVCLGWLVATLVAFAYRAISAAQSGPLWSDYRTRRVLVTIVGFAICLVIAAQLFRQRPWLPTWEIELHKNMPYFELSPNGSFLYVHPRSRMLRSGKPDPDQIFELTGRPVIAREFSFESENVTFSPNGKLIAADGIQVCRLLDRATGQALHTWPLRGDERIRQLQFTKTGQQLLMTTMTHRIQRLYVINLDDADLPKPRLFPFVGFLFLDPTGEVLVKLYLPQDETNEQRVEIVSRQDETILGQIDDLPAVDQFPIFSASGDHLAFANRVWKRTGGRPTAFVDRVVGITEGKRAIVFNQEKQPSWERVAPFWLARMPFARHILLRGTFSELQVVDIETGDIRARSPAYEFLMSARLSADGGTIAVVDSEGRIRIWNVPER